MQVSNLVVKQLPRNRIATKRNGKESIKLREQAPCTEIRKRRGMPDIIELVEVVK